MNGNFINSHSLGENQMKYLQGDYGRIFVVRLEDGDVINREIENLAKKRIFSEACSLFWEGPISEAM